MHTYQEPYSIQNISDAAIAGTAADITINCRKFIIANIGAQPLYFKEKTIDGLACTASNGMLVPANTVFPVILTATTLSVISNSTGTTYSIMYLDI